MIPIRNLYPISAAFLLAIGCSAPQPAATSDAAPAFNLDSVRALVMEQNKQFTDAHVAGNAAVIDSMFTNNARSYPPGAAAAIGVQAIHSLTVEFLKVGITEFHEETTQFYGNAEYVVDEGTYTLTYGKGVNERGKYMNVWKNVDGKWRIQANMWNTDAPAPTSK